MITEKTPEEIEAERENMRRLYLAIGQFIGFRPSSVRSSWVVIPAKSGIQGRRLPSRSEIFLSAGGNGTMNLAGYRSYRPPRRAGSRAKTSGKNGVTSGTRKLS